MSDAHLTQPLKLLIEPFAGSAAVSIALLEAGYTENIALCDSDPLVGNFWRVVFGPDYRYNDLRDWIAQTPITLTEFHEVHRLEGKDPVEAAFKCLFLNRTSFSGVIHRGSGPIGGTRQRSDYKIDCRFPRQALLERLDKLHAMRHRVLYAGKRPYNRMTQSRPVNRIVTAEPHRVLWYMDPPFFCKADRLYNHTFCYADHKRFRKYVKRELSGHWIVSYDDVPNARALWSDCDNVSEASLTYSVRSEQRSGQQQNQRATAKELLMSSFYSESSGQVIDLNRRHKQRRQFIPVKFGQVAKA